MTTETQVDDHLQVLANGVRIVRLGSSDIAWIREYAPILRVAATDFLGRGHMPGDAAHVVETLADTLTHGGAVWLVVDNQYRLLGFAAAHFRSAAWANTLVVDVPCMYLYPRKTPRAARPALVRTMLEWARLNGAASVYFTSRRIHDPAWEKITGARRIAAVYEVTLGEAP